MIGGSTPSLALAGLRARGSRTLLSALGIVAASLPHQLSGGEQERRVVDERAGDREALLLADEPTGNLDAEAGAEVLRLLRAGADEGRAVVMVTHEAGATAMADRVLRLDGGQLQPW